MEITQEVESYSIHDALLVRALEENLAIVRFDTNRRVTYVNDNFAGALKYTREEIIGKEHKTFCFPDFYTSPAYQGLWDNLLKGVSFQDKIMRKSAHGEVIWLEATYFPIYNEDRTRVIGVSKVATDITARQQAIETVTADLLGLSQKLTVSSRKGIEKGETLLEGSEKMIDRSSESTANLSQLQSRNESVHKIVRTIQDIASKTNLLALNASIEAARSGKYGLGFNVIANEVKRLSKQVHESAESIRMDIQAVTEDIDVVVEGSRKLKDQIQKSEEDIQETIQEFGRISSESEYLQRQADKLETII